MADWEDEEDEGADGGCLSFGVVVWGFLFWPFSFVFVCAELDMVSTVTMELTRDYHVLLGNCIMTTVVGCKLHGTWIHQ